MRKGVMIGTAAGLLAVAAVLVLVPMVSGGSSSSTSTTALQVETPEGYCGDVTVAATVSGTAYRPVLDLLGITRVDGLEVSDISVVGDAGCGDDVEAFDTYVRVLNGECDQSGGDERHASLCDGTALSLHQISATGAVSEQGLYDSYPLGAAWASGERWCAQVEAGLTFHSDAGEFVSSDAQPGQLCVDLG